MIKQTKEVYSCIVCPFYREGQGGEMWCGHPIHKHESEAHIITQQNRHEIPFECPLRANPVTTIVRLKA